MQLVMYNVTCIVKQIKEALQLKIGAQDSTFYPLDAGQNGLLLKMLCKRPATFFRA